MNVSDVINRTIKCSCGAEHRCDIEDLYIGQGALSHLSDVIKKYNNIMLISDKNTDAICGDKVRSIIGDKLSGCCTFQTEDTLIPNETSVAEAQSHMPEDADFVLGIGSGVINDICKYVSFNHNIKCGIIATATSMDGYASSGAAMIFDDMKVTFTTHAPSVIIGDTDILKNAPMDMIRSGSEHHLSHYFEITGLIDDKPYFFHGTDVGYSTIVTAKLREKILTVLTPSFKKYDEKFRTEEYKRIYKNRWEEVFKLQKQCEYYQKDLSGVYIKKWDEIRLILSECPGADEITNMLLDVGFKINKFEDMYGMEEKDYKLEEFALIHPGGGVGKDITK